MKKFPKLASTWELLAYDAPPTIDVEFLDGNKNFVLVPNYHKTSLFFNNSYYHHRQTGKKKRFMADGYSQREMQSIVDNWAFDAHLKYMKENNMEHIPEDD